MEGHTEYGALRYNFIAINAGSRSRAASQQLYRVYSNHSWENINDSCHL